jgi:hypothetical protein
MVFPELVVQTALILLFRRHMCATLGLQHGYQLIHAALVLRPLRRLRGVLSTLGPLVAIEGVGWLGAGSAALNGTSGAAPAVPSSSSAELCSVAYQPAFNVLACLLLGYHSYAAELRQRRAFLHGLRNSGAAHPAGLSSISGAAPLAHMRSADFWLFFAVPAASVLLQLYLHTA